MPTPTSPAGSAVFHQKGSKKGDPPHDGFHPLAEAMALAPPAPHPDALAAMRLSPEPFNAVCIANPQAVKPVPATAVC